MRRGSQAWRRAPCVLSCVNLLLGCGALLVCLPDSGPAYGAAAWMIIAAAAVDGSDGWLARRLDAESRFGAHLDSLADLLSFGMAPAFLLHTRFIGTGPSLWTIAPACMVLAGALRLARFSVAADERGDDYKGMPITMNGFLTAASILLVEQLRDSGVGAGPGTWVARVVLVSAIVNSLLMVSRIPFRALGWFAARCRSPVGAAAAVLVIAAIMLFPGPAGVGIGCIYITGSLVRYFIAVPGGWKRRLAGVFAAVNQ